MPWQRAGRTRVLAEAVDFRPHLDQHERAGLEAALEAAGILAAEITDDGTLHTADGTLVARAATPVDAPLSALLVADDPAVDAVLAGVSTDPGGAARPRRARRRRGRGRLPQRRARDGTHRPGRRRGPSPKGGGKAGCAHAAVPSISRAVFEEPEIHVIDFSGAAGDEHRAERERQQQEARRRYHALLETSLVGLGVDPDDVPRLAAGVLDCLVDAHRDDGSPCSCARHPHLPATNLHGYGFACPCQQTADERRRHWQAWRAERDAYWASPEGQQQTSRRQAEEDELVAWLAGQPDVVVTSYGGAASEQWWGSVAGRK